MVAMMARLEFITIPQSIDNPSVKSLLNVSNVTESPNK